MKIDRSMMIIVAFCLIGPGIMINVAGSEQYDDTMISAREITEGSYSFSLNSSDVRDYYKFIGMGFQIASMKIETGTPSLLDAFFLDETGNILKRFVYESRYEDAYLAEYLIDGTNYFYIKVEGTTSVDYTLTLEFKDQDDMGIGADATIAGTDLVKYSGWGQLGGMDKIDTYRFVPVPGSTLDLKIESLQIGHRVELIDPDDHIEMTWDVDQGREVSSSYNFDATVDQNDYFSIKIIGSELDTSYKMNMIFKDQMDGGTTMDAPAYWGEPLSFNATSYFLGSLGGSDLYDSYQIWIEEEDYLSVNFNSGSGLPMILRLQQRSGSEPPVDLIRYYDEDRSYYSIGTAEDQQDRYEFLIPREMWNSYVFILVMRAYDIGPMANYPGYNTYSFSIGPHYFSSDPEPDQGSTINTSRFIKAPELGRNERFTEMMIKGHIGTEDNEDVFKLETKENMAVMIDVLTSDMEDNIDVKLATMWREIPMERRNIRFDFDQESGTYSGKYTFSAEDDLENVTIWIENQRLYGTFISYTLKITYIYQNDTGTGKDASGIEEFAVPSRGRSGWIDSRGDSEDCYSLEVKKGDLVILIVEPDEDLSFDLSLFLSVEPGFGWGDQSSGEIGEEISIRYLAKENMTITVVVRAKEGYGSYEKLFRSDPAPLPKIDRQSITVISIMNYIQFNWDPIESLFEEYHVYRHGGIPYEEILIRTLENSVHSFRDYPPVPGQIYFYEIVTATGDREGNSVSVEIRSPEARADTDGDGLPDIWEIQNGLQTNYDDSFKDPDEDGYDNFLEFLHDSNPHDRSSIPDDGQIKAYEGDLDRDGMNDRWERDHDLDPLNSSDPGLDPDEDGMTNLQEFLNGTDPNVFDESNNMASPEKEENKENGSNQYFGPIIGAIIIIAFIAILILIGIQKERSDKNESDDRRKDSEMFRKKDQNISFPRELKVRRTK